MKKIITFLGAALLIAGCFLPIMNIGKDTFTFFDKLPVVIPDVPPNALMYTAILIIAIAIIAFIMALLNKTKRLWLTGIFTGAILTCVYYGMQAKMREMKDQADKQVNNLFGGLFKGVTDSMFQTVHLGGTAWYVIGTGAALLILGSILRSKQQSIQ